MTTPDLVALWALVEAVECRRVTTAALHAHMGTCDDCHFGRPSALSCSAVELYAQLRAAVTEMDIALPAALEALGRMESIATDRDRLQAWVHDLQAGMYINCVYCGHRYGPDDEVPATMADVLKEHIEHCPKHPMSTLKARLAQLEEALARYGKHRANCGPATPTTDLQSLCTCRLDAVLEGRDE